MNKTEFLSFIEHPENIGSVSLAESEKVLGKFPYWQSARLIFVKALQQQQHFSYDSQLKLAAIYAGNRSKLFDLINKNLEVAVSESEGKGESGISDMGHPERSRRSAEGDGTSSQLAVGNQTNEIENDLITIEKFEEPSNIEDSNETGAENIIVTESLFSENIEILTTESNVEEPIETSDENIIATENSFSENIEILTDEKEDLNESENDLSKIIEQRIKELTEQNSSYGVTESEDSVTENVFENAASLNDENIQSEIENDTSDKSSFEDDTVSIEEEMAAIDVYEETTIADDIFNNDSISVISTPETVVELKTETSDSKEINSSQHSFLEWFKFLKEDESSSSSNQVVGHPERSRRSAEDDDSIINSSSALANANKNDKSESEDESQIEESSITIIVSEESSTHEESHSEPSENAETLKPKPETTNSVTPPLGAGGPTSNLIDKFIEEDPRIQPKKSAFFSPSVAARKSVEYDDEFVSETLAEIFYRQQLYDKALKAYEKLTLMFPEKSTLFAARIKKIKEESKSGK